MIGVVSINQESLLFTIFAVKENDEYRNIFTYIRNQVDVPTFEWTSLSGKHGVKRFNGCFSLNEGKCLIERMTSNSSFGCHVKGEDINITFGNLKKRDPVFLPYDYQNSVANGWWPGTLRHGFWLDEWYCLNANTTLHDGTVDFIRKSTGFDLHRLPDFINTILRITSLEAYTPQIIYNPDQKNIVFMLNGEVEPCKHRVVINLFETKEALYCETIDLPQGIEYVALPAPFEPKYCGFDLYKKENDKWILIASANHALVRKIFIRMGLIQGKLKVEKNDESEECDIVSYEEHPVEIKTPYEPWVIAEEERERLNQAFELRQLGSIFVRNDGQGNRDKIASIIHDVIYESAYKNIYIWDPYLDESVLDYLIYMALKIPSIKIKLLLSESGKKKDCIKPDGSMDLSVFQRCKGIESFLSHQDKSLHNLEARNWFREGNPAFHDRFIITDIGVWHLGSSLKDIGNYHTTIYRLHEELAKQVREEFENAWGGDFGALKPYGFSFYPNFQWFHKPERMNE
jgi:hypothetical protein